MNEDCIPAGFSGPCLVNVADKMVSFLPQYRVRLPAAFEQGDLLSSLVTLIMSSLFTEVLPALFPPYIRVLTTERSSFYSEDRFGDLPSLILTSSTIPLRQSCMPKRDRTE